ncbi:DUF4214 domain-containing protein [Synechococcus elongatus]|uniref:DUF4214 domain-containing protein n=1 Tax=Synechococcus elongatus PCC 11802 TaxID=2283154 RepID=A0AAT9JV12_SYNEL|nr:DUF4214 domain-containing protein [Synechococcus elongatus]QFZ92740.1 DUF4214 domain-containing protein [Synechococcus elongatus PCC 11802]
MAIILNADNAQLLYVAYYGRPGDNAGIRFWQTRLRQTGFSFDPANGDFIDSPEEQAVFDQFINTFGTSPEADALYDGLSNEEVINIVYRQLFNREAEAGGFAFWLEQLNSGAVTIPEFAFTVALAARNEDIVTLNAKIESAKRFSSSIDTDIEGAAYNNANFAGAVQAGRDFLAQFGPDVATQAEVDQALADLVAEATPAFQVSVAPDSSVEGSAFTVTVITNNIPNGTKIGFTVGGSDALVTTSGEITIVNGIGVATIFTKADADSVNDLATIQLTSLPNTPFGPIPAPSAQFTIAEPPPNSSFILTAGQDIVDGTGVDTFTFFGNEQTVGNGDILGRGEAELAILDITTTGDFNIAGFELDGVQRIELFANNGDQFDTGFLNLSRAFGLETIFVDQSDLGVITFRDIQTGNGLFIDILDSASFFQVNIDANSLLGSNDTVDIRVAESPIDEDSNRAVSFDFTQGPNFTAAQIETINLESASFGGFDSNVIDLLRVGNALTTLNITGNADLEFLSDIGVRDFNRNGQISLINAETLDGDLIFDYTSNVRGVVEVLGAIGDNTLGLFSNAIGRPDSVGPTSFDVILQDGDDSVVTDLGNDTIAAAEGDNTIVSTTFGFLPNGLFDDIIVDPYAPEFVAPLFGPLPILNSTVTFDRDIVTAGDGDNSVLTGSGNDAVSVGDGDNFIDASGFVTDTVVINSRGDTVFAATFFDRDTVTAGDGDNTVITGESDDIITTGSGSDLIDAGVAYTRVRLVEVTEDRDREPRFDSVPIDTDNDIVNAGDGTNTVLTGFGNDSVISGSGSDSINVGTGEFAGNNTVDAGGGNNTVVAGFGNDSVITGGGDDTIVASNGDNIVRSGEGNDIIAIGSGEDAIFAGGGNDTISLKGENLTDVDFIDGGEGTRDFISFTAGDVIERSETAGVRNIEGFELLNFGGVVGKRLGLLNNETPAEGIIPGTGPLPFGGTGEVSIVNQLEGLRSLLLSDQSFRDVAINLLGLPAVNRLTGTGAGSIVELIDDINEFIDDVISQGGLNENGLPNFTQADLRDLSNLLNRVAALQDRFSGVRPDVSDAFDIIDSNLDQLRLELGNSEFNKIFVDESTNKFLGGFGDYFITLDQALVASSNDIRAAGEFLPNQAVKFFTIDAELATSAVTVDATTVQQVDGQLIRQGLAFFGQTALVQGGIERIIIGDSLTSSTLVLNYGDTIQDDRDVLRLVNSATFTASDLSNITGLDRIELTSASSILGQTFNITLTKDFLDAQGGRRDGSVGRFVITADPSLPPGSTLNLNLGAGIPVGRVLVLQSGNLTVNITGPGAGSAVIRDAFFFTENTDVIQGTSDPDGDEIVAFEAGDLNPSDSVNGGGGADTVFFNFGLANAQVVTSSIAGLSLAEQLSFVDFDDIEGFIFDPVKATDAVRFAGFNGIGSSTLSTSSAPGGQLEEIDLFDLNFLNTARDNLSRNDIIFLDDTVGSASAFFGNANLVLSVLGGNDTVSGVDEGQYFVLAGDGNDSIDFSDGNPQSPLNGGADTVDGDSGNDTIRTGGGNDSILGGTGFDLIFAGNGTNIIDAGADSDTVTAGTGNDSILGGTGNDSILAGDGNNFVNGGTGNDTITAGTGNDSILGGEGNDSILAGDGDNRIDGGADADTITAGIGNDSILGGEGADSINAGAGNNTVDGGTGNDTIVSEGSGSDSILGGTGSDSILLTAANALSSTDTIIGGSGSDTLNFNISTDTDLAPRVGDPLNPGNLPLGPVDIDPVFSGIDQLIAGIGAEASLRLARTVAAQSDAANGINIVANATGEDVIVTAGLIAPNANDGGFVVGQSLNIVSNGFFSSSDSISTAAFGAAPSIAPAGSIQAGLAGIGVPETITRITNEATPGVGGTTALEKRALINGFLFSDLNAPGNVGAGVVGGSGADSITAGSKPTLVGGNNDPLLIEKTRGFVSYQGNGGADSITLTADPAVANPAVTDAFSEFVRYVTANDGSAAGQSSGFDVIRNFDNGGITLYGTDPGQAINAGSVVDFNSEVTVGANGLSDPIDVDRGPGFSTANDGVNIDNITGDKIVIGGSLLAGISGSNGNYLLDAFAVDRGGDFDDIEAIFLTNAQGFSDADITNFGTIASRINSLATGINVDSNDGGLIIAQGQTLSAIYYFNNDSGPSGADATVEVGELRLLAVVDTANLAADDFLFQVTQAPIV